MDVHDWAINLDVGATTQSHRRFDDVEGDLANLPQNQCLLADCHVCFRELLAHSAARTSKRVGSGDDTREQTASTELEPTKRRELFRPVKPRRLLEAFASLRLMR